MEESFASEISTYWKWIKFEKVWQSRVKFKLFESEENSFAEIYVTSSRENENKVISYMKTISVAKWKWKYFDAIKINTPRFCTKITQTAISSYISIQRLIVANIVDKLLSLSARQQNSWRASSWCSVRILMWIKVLKKYKLSIKSLHSKKIE